MLAELGRFEASDGEATLAEIHNSEKAVARFGEPIDCAWSTEDRGPRACWSARAGEESTADKFPSQLPAVARSAQ